MASIRFTNRSAKEQQVDLTIGRFRLSPLTVAIYGIDGLVPVDINTLEHIPGTQYEYVKTEPTHEHIREVLAATLIVPASRVAPPTEAFANPDLPGNNREMPNGQPAPNMGYPVAGMTNDLTPVETSEVVLELDDAGHVAVRFETQAPVAGFNVFKVVDSAGNQVSVRTSQAEYVKNITLGTDIDQSTTEDNLLLADTTAAGDYEIEIKQLERIYRGILTAPAPAEVPEPVEPTAVTFTLGTPTVTDNVFAATVTEGGAALDLSTATYVKDLTTPADLAVPTTPELHIPLTHAAGTLSVEFKIGEVVYVGDVVVPAPVVEDEPGE